MLHTLNWLLKVMCVLMAAIYFTMLERKMMGYMQLRKGPNKVGILGLFTPMADSLKLLVKSFSKPLSSKYFVFWISPMFSVMFLELVWMLFPFKKSNLNFTFSFLFFLCFSSLNVYVILGSGWGSNSKYPLLGAIRGSAQVISYEVCLILVSFAPFIFLGGYNLKGFINYSSLNFWLFPLVLIWIVTSIAETNRAPFDFSEGESELVSGFNTEYGSLEFACLFLGEYGNIIFLKFLSVLIWLAIKIMWVILLGVLLSLSFMWFRSTFVRFRYDLFMKLAWSIVLPYLLCFLFFMFIH